MESDKAATGPYPTWAGDWIESTPEPGSVWSRNLGYTRNKLQELAMSPNSRLGSFDYPIISLAGTERRNFFFREQAKLALNTALMSKYQTYGPFVQELELHIATRFHRTSDRVELVGSGTQGLELAILAYVRFSNSQKRKAIVPSHSFWATLEAVKNAGLEPVFVDADPETGLMDTKILGDTIDRYQNELVLIISTDVLGQELNSSYLQYSTIPVIYDAAPSFGKLRTDLDATIVYSLSPLKPIGGFGPMGAVVSKNLIGERIHQLKNHGRIPGTTRHSDIQGSTNGYPSVLDCVYVREQLEYSDLMLARRKQIYKYYASELQQFEYLQQKFSNCYYFQLLSKNRDRFRSRIEEKRIETKTHWGQSLDPNKSRSPVAWRIAEEGVSIPMHSFLTDLEVEYIIENVKKCWRD